MIRPARAALVATQIAGLITARYVLKLEPLPSADPEALVAAIGPNVQRFLTDPLPGLLSAAPPAEDLV